MTRSARAAGADAIHNRLPSVYRDRYQGIITAGRTPTRHDTMPEHPRSNFLTRLGGFATDPQSRGRDAITRLRCRIPSLRCGRGALRVCAHPHTRTRGSTSFAASDARQTQISGDPDTVLRYEKRLPSPDGTTVWAALSLTTGGARNCQTCTTAGRTDRTRCTLQDADGARDGPPTVRRMILIR